MLLPKELLISADTSSVARQHSLAMAVQMLCSLLLVCCLSLVQPPTYSQSSCSADSNHYFSSSLILGSYEATNT